MPIRIPTTFLVAVAAWALAGCGSEGAGDAARVEFPAERPERAIHCHVVLQLRTQQVSDVAGEGRFGQWVASDFNEAQAAAAAEADPSVIRGDFDALRERISETMRAFDVDSDQRIDGAGELEEFSRHVDLCMREFLPQD
ncbi:MAG TPA: hypothetical protein VIE68_08160 [Gemmatimonadota bacterium]|jgi:hypothetical protein